MKYFARSYAVDIRGGNILYPRAWSLRRGDLRRHFRTMSCLCRVMSADVLDDEVMRGGTETLTIHKRILKELQVEVSLNDSCYKHFQNWIYLCIIQGSSGAALHSRAGQGRGLSPTEFFVGQTGKGSDSLCDITRGGPPEPCVFNNSRLKMDANADGFF